MRYPVYWARAKFVGRDAHGKPVHRWAWGWSAESQASAAELADHRARRAVQREANDAADADDYGYGVDPAREEVLSEPTDSLGEHVGAITRNRAGSEILNSYRVMFVDIDSRQGRVSRPLPRWWYRLFPPRRLESRRSVASRSPISHAYAWHTTHPETPLRIYRTAAGWRLVVGDRLYEPTATDTLQLMHEFESDRLYVSLCARQHTFRARLTPKPWRIGVKSPRGVFPFRNQSDIEHQRAWEDKYNARCKDYAVCELIAHLGPVVANASVQALVNLHDHYTLRPGRPLA